MIKKTKNEVKILIIFFLKKKKNINIIFYCFKLFLISINNSFYLKKNYFIF
jgi:hypothetical protein